MDADTLRLILFVLGCLVILGIYLWDRYKRTIGGKLKIRIDKKMPPWAREAPALNRTELDDALDKGMELDNTLLDPLELPEDRKGAKREGPLMKKARGKVRSVNRIGAGEQPTPSDPLGAEEKILQLFVRSRKEEIGGEALLRAARKVGLRHGKMDIFHHHDGALADSAVVFSVASMVNPGTIPLKDIGNFSTPGLALFARLPGVKDGIKVFQEMLHVAGELSEILNAEVLDDARQALTPERVETIRNEIIEHRRQTGATAGHP